MMKLGRILFLAPFLLASAVAAAELNINVNDVIIGVQENYKDLKSFEAKGRLVTVIEGSRPYPSEAVFSFRLKKPNLYRIVWEAQRPYMATVTNAVWNSGDGPYLYRGIAEYYGRVASEASAITTAALMTQGVAGHIPSLFFPTVGDYYSPLRLENLKLVRTEQVEGETCYVVEGAFAASAKQTLWISTKRQLIIQASHTLERPKDAKPVEIPEMTDEEIEQSLKEMGTEVTEESKKRVREVRAHTRRLNEIAESIRATSTITYTDIVTDGELTTEDLTFTVPEGAVLKENLFGLPAEPTPSAERVPDAPQPPKWVLEKKLRKIDIATLEVKELTVGNWQKLGQQEGRYKNPSTGKYTMVSAITCAACGEFIPRPEVPGLAAGGSPEQIRKALSEYVCPKCGQKAFAETSKSPL